MALDPNVFNNQRTYQDFARAEEDFQLKKVLQAATIQQMEAKAQADLRPDISKLGEEAYMMAAQGIPLDPQRAAALQYLDAKSQTVTFNPVTGVREDRPSLLQRSGMQFGQQAPSPQAPPPSPRLAADEAANIVDLYGAQDDVMPKQSANPWDIQFQQEYDALAGNPKAQAALKLQYSKEKLSPTEGQSSAALYADRMAEAMPLIEKAATAVQNPKDIALGSIPMIGNYLTSEDYQSGIQAQRNFLNAVLRRESGAVINPDEFASGTKQYFPKAGDSPKVLAQKAANRETALKGIQRSAGASYQAKPTTQTPQSSTGGWTIKVKQ
jgi:hypothetical protein